MPNLCRNEVVFLGKASDVAEAYAFLKGCETEDQSSRNADRGLDFNLILPEPEDLRSINDTVSAIVKNRLIERYGFWNTFEWRISNWGQKWNFLEISHDVPPEPSESDFESEARIHFDSPWTPVRGIAAALSERFPAVAVILVHEEAGNDLFGADAYFRGEQVKTVRFSADGLMNDIREDDEAADEIQSERINDRLGEVEQELVQFLSEYIDATT